MPKRPSKKRSARPARGRPKAKAPRYVAYHEAGHAVMALMVGRDFDLVTVNPTEDFPGRVIGYDSGRYVFVGQGSDGGDRYLFIQREWRNVLVALAGPAAMSRATQYIGGSSGDVEYAARHLRLIRPSLDERAARALAAQMLPHADAVLKKAWPAVRAIAEALLELGEIELDSARDIFRDTLPDDVPYELLECPLPESAEARASSAWVGESVDRPEDT